MKAGTRGVTAGVSALLLLLLLTATVSAAAIKADPSADNSLEAELESSLLPQEGAKASVGSSAPTEKLDEKALEQLHKPDDGYTEKQQPPKKDNPSGTESKALAATDIPVEANDGEAQGEGRFQSFDSRRLRQLFDQLLDDEERRSLRLRLEPEAVKKTVADLKEEAKRDTNKESHTPSRVRMRRSMESSMSMESATETGRRRRKRDLGDEYYRNYNDYSTRENSGETANPINRVGDGDDDALPEGPKSEPPLTMFVANVKGEPGIFVPFDQEGAAIVAEAVAERQAEQLIEEAVEERRQERKAAEQLVEMLEQQQAAERAIELAEAERRAEDEAEAVAEAEDLAEAEAEAEAEAQAEADEKRAEDAAKAQAELRRFAEKLATYEEDPSSRAVY